jgi:hypothetical protein
MPTAKTFAFSETLLQLTPEYLPHLNAISVVLYDLIQLAAPQRENLTSVPLNLYPTKINIL